MSGVDDVTPDADAGVPGGDAGVPGPSGVPERSTRAELRRAGNRGEVPGEVPGGSDVPGVSAVPVERRGDGEAVPVEVRRGAGIPPVPATPAAEAAIAPLAPAVESPSSDVATAGDAPALPGAHRGGFRRALTEPVPVAEPVHEVEPEVQWAPIPAPLPRSAPWALTFAILGLTFSFLVGWGFLVGIVGAVLAIVALRRPWESRRLAVWALCLSLLSLLYSAGWLWWASTQGPLLG